MFYRYLLLPILLLNVQAYAQQITIPRSALYLYEGTYELANQHRITLGIFDELHQNLAYLDLQNLKIGVLIPVSTHTFRDSNDSSKVFSFHVEDNQVKGLSLCTNNNSSDGKKIALHQVEEISFQSGQNLIKGDLYLPVGKGNYPVVVFAHGSGPSTRGVSFFTTFFLQLGIGVLTFDKQGAGASTGDWETASFDELAADLIAGINFLKTRKNIDTTKIGLMGNSQGGWTGSITAARIKNLAFLVMRVGAGESVFNTISHEYTGTLIDDGFAPTAVKEIMEMYRSNWKMAAMGKTWEEGNQHLQTYKNRSWFKKVYPEERVKTERSVKWWIWLGKNLQYDSYPYLQHIKTPTLWLLAEKDWNVNSQKSLPRIKEALSIAKNKDYEVAILPNMAHNGMVAKNGYANEALSFTYAPGFWDKLSTWLLERKIGKQ